LEELRRRTCVVTKTMKRIIYPLSRKQSQGVRFSGGRFECSVGDPRRPSMSSLVDQNDP
jgi:hypothetical protein